jgi:hypothetical protein
MYRTAARLGLACLLAAGIALPALARPIAESAGSVRSVRDFDKVEISIQGEVILTQGAAETLEIVASAADLARISTAVSMGTLRIGSVRPDDSPRGRITYTLTMKSVAALTTSSSGSIRAERIETDRLAIAVHSSGPVTIAALSASTLVVEISSSGAVTVAGTVGRQTLRSSSSGEYRAEDLVSREATVNLSSSGRATIRVSEQLTASLSSSGDVRYRGSPPKVTVSASSSGRLVKLD